MRVLVVDDHPLIREGLAQVLRDMDPQTEVVPAEDADSALEHAPRSRLILLDLLVPGAVGLSLLNRLRQDHPEVPVVVLSAQDGRDHVLAAIDAGAMGFISKRSPTGVLINALRLVLAGGVYVPPQVLAATAAPGAPVPDAGAPAAARTPADIGLTGRQADVLALLVQGKPNKVICRELDLAEGTVKTHITAILRALNVSNRTQALFALSRLGVQVASPMGPRPGGAANESPR